MQQPPKKRGRPAKFTRASRYELSVIEQKDGTVLVSWPADEIGKRRRRRVFQSPSAAQKFADSKRADFTNRGRKVAGLRATAADDAAEAAALLAPYGITILACAQDYVSRAQARVRSQLVLDAVNSFLEDRRPNTSKRYYGDLSARLKRLAKEFPDSYVSDLTTRDLGPWINAPTRSAVDAGNTRRVLSVFFGWCKLHHLAKDNPVLDVPAAKEPDPPCDTFTPDELRLILDACPPALVPFIAIQAFAGLRSAEVARLDWSEVDFRRKMVKVDASKSKTGARRFVPMPAALIAWIQPHAKDAGSVAPKNPNGVLCKFRKSLATFEDEKRRVKWRHNALRHSFASYSLAIHEDAPKVALWCGHDVKTLLKHYRDLVAAEDGREWFATMPVSQPQAEVEQ